MEKLDDKQWRDLALYDSHEVDAMSEDVYEVVMRGRDHRGDVLRFRGAFQGLEKVIAHGPTDHRLPVLLQEDITRRVNQEQTVDHRDGLRTEAAGNIKSIKVHRL